MYKYNIDLNKTLPIPMELIIAIKLKIIPNSTMVTTVKLQKNNFQLFWKNKNNSIANTIAPKQLNQKVLGSNIQTLKPPRKFSVFVNGNKNTFEAAAKGSQIEFTILINDISPVLSVVPNISGAW